MCDTSRDTIHPNNMALGHAIDLAGEVPKATHQSNLRVLRTKGGRWFVGKTSKSPVKKWMAALTAAANTSQSKPLEKLMGPISVSIIFCFARPKCRKKPNQDAWTWHTGKPDLDNAAKAVLDAIGDAGWWEDDSQVCSLTLSKIEADKPWISIRVKRLVRP